MFFNIIVEIIWFSFIILKLICKNSVNIIVYNIVIIISYKNSLITFSSI